MKTVTCFEIVRPGTWIVVGGRRIHDLKTESEMRAHSQRSSRLISQLSQLETLFFDAVVAADLFARAWAHMWEDLRKNRPGELDELAMAEREREDEIRDGVIREIPGADAQRFEAEVQIKRDKWSRGKLPSTFINSLPKLHAQSFLHSADLFGKFLRVLTGDPDAPATIRGIYENDFLQAFPDLVGVRNTTEHLEDRSRGLGKPKGKGHHPLVVQPFKPGGPIIGTALVLSSLHGTKFGNTMADGHFGQVDVSLASVLHMQRILQGVLDSFQWEGRPSHLPA